MRRLAGFSLVEMLVALVFTGLLMAGLATVFKGSLTTFTTAGEKTSASRRNQSSLDLLYEDINAIGLYLQDLQGQPQNTDPGNPLFYILPNQPVTGAPADGPAFADQMFFYVDQPFQFQGKLSVIAAVDPTNPNAKDYTNASTMVQSHQTLTSYNPGLTIDCGTYVYAMQVYNAFNTRSQPVTLTLMDSYENKIVTKVTQPTSNLLQIETGSVDSVSITGIGSVAGPSKNAHLTNTAALFFCPAQMIRYSIQMLQMDPTSTAGIPCLVRDQGTYSTAGFVPDATLQQVITENVSAFKVYLSVNPGYLTANNPAQAWAPFSAIPSPADFTSGWTNGIVADLNTQLQHSGRAGQTSTGSSLTWFRDIPTVVRIDMTTRTATKRSEYAATPTTLAYATTQRSLIMVPRQFGLPLNN